MPRTNSKKITKVIPYSRQTIDQTDIEAVESVLRSDFLTQGPVTPLFEERIAHFCRSNFAVSFNSATSALHAACLALGVGKGDIVWTTAISFVASANCAALCGAEVDFVDVDPKTINMSVEALEEKLQSAERMGCLPKVLIPVHFAGNPVNMESLVKLKAKYGFQVIEDASHALGAKRGNELVGSCKHSEITVFSFHAVKVITSGEGGMAVTNDPELSNKLRLICTHGVTRDPTSMQVKDRGAWYYEQSSIGFNYRMSEIHAALGMSQMDKIDTFTKLRNAAAAKYDEFLTGIDVTPLSIDPGNLSSRHLFIIRFDTPLDEKQYEWIFSAMRAENILVNHHYIPIYRHPYYQRKGSQTNCTEAEKYFMNALSLPLFPAISEEEVYRSANSLKTAVKTCLR